MVATVGRKKKNEKKNFLKTEITQDFNSHAAAAKLLVN